MSQYTRYPTISGGGGGSVNSVTASSPLSSTGGANPNISLTGIVPIANGGTGSSTQNFLSNKDTLYSLSNFSDATKLQKFDLSGQTTGTTLTITPQNTSNMVLHIPQVATASGAGMVLTQDETTGFIFGYGITSSLGGANSMFQLANATTANRAQIKLHSYFAGNSVAGVSTLTSRSGVIGTNSAVVAGQDYSKWTAQAGATTAGSAPISGSFAFKANSVNSLTVPSDFHIQLTNIAGTLADRLYLSSEGLLQLPGYSTGVSVFDSSGNISSVAPGTSGNVLTSNGTTWISSPAAGSGANTSLSNLITTSINQALIPDSNLARDLGTNALLWRDAYIRNLKDNSGLISISVDNRYLADIGGTPVASYATGGRFSLQAGVTLDLNGSTSGALRLKAAAVTTNHTLIMPATQGAASTVLTNDGAGNLSWAPTSGSSTPNKETFVLSGTDITNQYIDLAHVAQTNSILFLILGLQSAIEGASYDYTVSYTGGAGGNTRITFLNGIATGGVSALVASDVIQINYIY